MRLDLTDGRAQVQVGDDGSGIQAALLPHVFDLFTQGGLRLGLALARAIVMAHGGRILAHSGGPGRASCFMEEVPLAAGTGQDGGEDGGASAAGAPRTR